MTINKLVAGAKGDPLNSTGADVRDAVNGLIDISKSNIRNYGEFYTPFGNSITAEVNGFWSWFYFASDGSLTFLENKGVGGDTTQDMIDRIDAIDSKTTLCTVMEGSNDVGQGVTPEQHAINIKTILLGLIAKGIKPVLLLAPPKSNQAHADSLREMNLRVWLVARSLGVICLNPWDQFSDGFGQWKAGLSGDGTHPNSSTAKLAGDTLWPLYEKQKSCYPLNTNNATGVILNGLFMNDTNADGKPDDWEVIDGQGHSLSSTSLGVGNTFYFKALSNFSYTYQLFSLDLGKTYSFGIKFSIEFLSRVDGKFEMYLQSPAGVRTYIIQNGFESYTNKLAAHEFVAGEAGSWRFYVVANGTDYECDISIAQATMFCTSDLETA